jgi:poly(3-hydroxyalkanoate) depolymerase
MFLNDSLAAESEQSRGASAIEARMMTVGEQPLMVAVKHGDQGRPPLLLFNGIGANWELAKPFLLALAHTTTIIFDIPGIGGSPLPKRPYRPSNIAKLGAHLVAALGHREVDVAGVSWGGGIAQQFAYQYPKVCRRLVLAATSPGALMIPGRPEALMRISTPRRYWDKGYMRKAAPEIYGGAFRKDPSLVERHAAGMFGATRLGYVYQLLALVGWSSLPWLRRIRQPTLVLMGRDDPLVPVANGSILSRLIPNARLEIIDDGHLFLITQAESVARRIESFLNGDG